MPDDICSEPGCSKSASAPNTARGLCPTHYSRLQRAGAFRRIKHDACQAEGCDRAADLPVVGLCGKHYHRLKRHGSPTGGSPTGTAEERFWARVVQGASADDCWGWSGSLHHHGYASIVVDGKTAPAHRFSYELANGPVPAELHIDHLCRNRGCTNPAHLEAVTPRVNILRGTGTSAANIRKTHCPQGHEYTPENTYVLPSRPRARYCRACAADRRRERRARQRAEGLRVT